VDFFLHQKKKETFVIYFPQEFLLH